MPEALFEPMLQAAANANEPSLGAKCVTAPCEAVFAPARVVAHLVSSAESADDPALVVGALDALDPRCGLEEIVEQRRTFLLHAVADENTSPYVRDRLRLHLWFDHPAARDAGGDDRQDS